MISYEIQDSVAVLKMDHGKVNAMDLEFLVEFSERLNELAAAYARAVVITGRGGVFSAGVDLFRVLDGGPEYTDRFLPLMAEMFGNFFLFPKPVIVAVNGHAVAGGCILSCASDMRLMADGTGRIGLSELSVGVPFPTTALEIVRFATPQRYLQEIIYTAATYSPREALQRGLIDEIVAEDQLMDRALQLARHLGSIPQQSFAIVKRLLRAPFVDRANAAVTEQSKVAELWKDPQIHSNIREYLQRTLRKK